MLKTLRSVVNAVDTLMKIPSNLYVPVRFRYFKDRPVFKRRWGYKDELAWRGMLPRLETRKMTPRPMYVPKYNWTENRALFGQNDYIDILGDPNIHPATISYNVPPWLRGFYGNEYQMLLRKRNFFGHQMQATSPSKYNELRKSIRYQYKFLNMHQPQNRWPRGLSRYWKNR